MKILIVDDEKLIRDGLKRMLEFQEHEVFTAKNGLEALLWLRDNTVDLVVTDIIMPEKDGIEVILAIRKDRPEQKIIAISGGGRINAQDHLEIALQLGVNAVLSKPFSANELFNKIDEVFA